MNSIRKLIGLYEFDVAVLKDYGTIRKLSLLRCIRRSGYEIPERRFKGTANETKLDENISSTRSRIFELAICNPWELFITLTIDAKKYDRKNLEGYRKDLAQWIRDYNKKHKTKVRYLLVPEQHRDGSWHMHGFLMGLPADHLKTNEHGYLDWFSYREKFGYCSMEKIRNHEAVSKYITKYISKNLSDCVKAVNAHMYYCSKGLKRAEVVKKGTLSDHRIPWDFQNEHCKTVWTQFETERLICLIE